LAGFGDNGSGFGDNGSILFHWYSSSSATASGGSRPGTPPPMVPRTPPRNKKGGGAAKRLGLSFACRRLVPEPLDQTRDTLDVNPGRARILVPHHRLQLVLIHLATVRESMAGGVAKRVRVTQPAIEAAAVGRGLEHLGERIASQPEPTALAHEHIRPFGLGLEGAQSAGIRLRESLRAIDAALLGAMSIVPGFRSIWSHSSSISSDTRNA
jgi:hypothetical protein